MTYHFQEEIENNGSRPNRIIYNPIFTKTCREVTSAP